jgi:hypothetical protein
MFDRVSEAAEKLATNVSRRAFLGRLGQGALGLAAVIGGVLALPSQARAGAGAAVWCRISNAPLVGCRTYKAINGTCPCGGILVRNQDVRRCSNVNC